MKPILLAFCILSCFMSVAQPKESYFVFDQNWKGTTIDSAKFLLRTMKLNDTTYQWDYYNFTGPLIKSEQTRDKDGHVLSGNVYYYDAEGFVDSLGEYNNGKKNGYSYRIGHREDSIVYNFEYVYKDDELVKSVDLLNQPKDTTGKYLEGQESEFPGGSKRWINYLQKNLNYPDRAMKAEFQGTVRVAFIVDAAGAVHDPFVAKSVEYSLDKETLRIINASGKWKPAFQNGKYVKSYKIQPITYRLK